MKDGKAAAGNVTVIARSGVGVAVRKGALKPDISSPEALKRTLLAAKSITYGNPAWNSPGGSHFAKVLDRLGIANEMKSKTVFLPKDISQDVVFDEAHNIINGSPSLSHLRVMCTVMVNKQS